LSLVVVFIAACRKRRQTAQQLLPLRTPAAIDCSPSGKLLQPINPLRALRTAGSSAMPAGLRRRRHDVTLAGTPRTPANVTIKISRIAIAFPYNDGM
jgi:hypothetical protein